MDLAVPEAQSFGPEAIQVSAADAEMVEELSTDDPAYVYHEAHDELTVDNDAAQTIVPYPAEDTEEAMEYDGDPDAQANSQEAARTEDGDVDIGEVEDIENGDTYGMEAVYSQEAVHNQEVSRDPGKGFEVDSGLPFDTDVDQISYERVPDATKPTAENDSENIVSVAIAEGSDVQVKGSDLWDPYAESDRGRGDDDVEETVSLARPGQAFSQALTATTEDASEHTASLAGQNDLNEGQETYHEGICEVGSEEQTATPVTKHARQAKRFSHEVSGINETVAENERTASETTDESAADTSDEADDTQPTKFADASSKGFEDTGAQKTQPIRLTFNDQSFALFSESSESPSYLVYNEVGDVVETVSAPRLELSSGVYWQSLQELFSSLRVREALGEFLEEAETGHELVMHMPELELTVREDSINACDVCLSDLVRLHLGLGLRDSLHIKVSEEPSFIGQFNLLAEQIKESHSQSVESSGAEPANSGLPTTQQKAPPSGPADNAERSERETAKEDTLGDAGSDDADELQVEAIGEDGNIQAESLGSVPADVSVGDYSHRRDATNDVPGEAVREHGDGTDAAGAGPDDASPEDAHSPGRTHDVEDQEGVGEEEFPDGSIDEEQIVEYEDDGITDGFTDATTGALGASEVRDTEVTTETGGEVLETVVEHSQGQEDGEVGEADADAEQEARDDEEDGEVGEEDADAEQEARDDEEYGPNSIFNAGQHDAADDGQPAIAAEPTLSRGKRLLIADSVGEGETTSSLVEFKKARAF